MPAVVTAFTGFFSGLGASKAWAAWLGSASVRLLTSVALGAVYTNLQRAQMKNMPSGIKSQVTQNGGVNPTSFVIGTYATAGYMVTPPMSHGVNNEYLTYVVEFCDIRRAAVSRLVIDGEYATIGGTPDGDGFYPVTGRFNNVARVKFYDGTQTTADAWLVATYGAYPSRPWTSDMIGRDQCYAIIVFKFNEEVYNGFPQIRIETTGIPFYDPRLDTTVGGSGPQRWATPSTWAASSNPMVQAYHIMRGIAFADGSVWGGGVAADDLPLTEWFAAMNACDVATALLGGGTEPAFRSGLEVRSNDEPMMVLEELAKASSAQYYDMGGVWKVKVGAVGLSVLSVTDDDLIITKSQEYDPFPNLSDTYNGVTATHPEPTSLYESVSAPIRTNATDETADGGRRLIADLSLPAVPYKDQVQRLMEAYRRDNRRFRRHAQSLGPSAMLLEPTDAISWTSAANGYTSKIFEVSSITDDLMTGLQRVALRERDSGDYAWNAATDTKATSPATGGKVVPTAQTVPGFAVAPALLTGDVAGVAIPTINITWTATDFLGIDGLKYQVRLVSSGVTIIRGSTQDFESGAISVANGIAGNTAYEVRARLIVPGRPTSWTAWTAVTTGTASYVIAGSGVFPDTGFTLQDDGDATKQGRFQLSGLTTGTTRTYTLPDVSGTLTAVNAGHTITGNWSFSGNASTFGTGTGATTTGLAAGATTTGNTKAVNIGTAGASGSTTNVQIGSSVAGALGTTTFNSPTVTFGATVTAINLPDVATFFQDNADTTKQAKFELSGITTGTTRTLAVPNASGTIALVDGVQTWTAAQTFRDNLFTLQDNTDNTKQVDFQVSGIATGTTRTFTFPNFGGATFLTDVGTQTVTGDKTFTGVVVLRDNGLTIQDNTDTTKAVDFQVSAVGTGVTRTFAFPNIGGSTFVVDAGAQTIGGVKTFSAAPVFPSFTVAGLPAATANARAFVTDSNATLATGHGNIVAGGGANYCPVYADGTNWRIG